MVFFLKTLVVLTLVVRHTDNVVTDVNSDISHYLKGGAQNKKGGAEIVAQKWRQYKNTGP